MPDKTSQRNSNESSPMPPFPPRPVSQLAQAGESRSDRWRRSQKTQWRTVSRKNNLDVVLKLEWTAPVIDTPHWGSPGIVYTEDASQAKLWAATFAKSLAPVALASRIKLGIENETCKVERLAFHVERTVKRGEVSQTSRQIVVGYVYYLTTARVAMSKQALQSTPAQVTTSVVIRLSTMQKYCPPPQAGVFGCRQDSHIP